MASIHIKGGCQALVFLVLVVSTSITAAASETKGGSGSCPEDAGGSDGICVQEVVGQHGAATSHPAQGNSLLRPEKLNVLETALAVEDEEDGDSEDEADEDDEETSMPDADDEIDGTADKYEEVVITDEDRDAEKTHSSHDDASSVLIDGKNVTETLMVFGRELSECMQDAITEANGDKDRLQLIERLIEYEMIEELQRLGADFSAEQMSLFEAVASSAAQQIVHEDFKSSVVKTLSNQTLTHLVVESFIDTFDSMARSCGEEDAATLERDERRLLTPEGGGNIENSSHVIPFDLAMVALNQCERDHMDVDFLAMHGATLKHHAQCSGKVSTALLGKDAELTHLVNYHIKSAMVLHNEDNGLKHHMASHFKIYSLAPNASNPSKGEMQKKLHDAALTNLKPATVARLLYIQDKHEHFLFGMARKEYCQKFSGNTDDIGVQAYIECVCHANQPSLVCHAKHATLLLTSTHEMMRKVKRAKVTHDEHLLALRGDTSSVTARNAFGPCAPPLECELCLGDECFSPSRSPSGRRRRRRRNKPVSRRRRRSDDVFESIVNIAEQGLAACPSGTCTFAYGAPSGSCALKLQMTMGMNAGDDCSVDHNVFSNFKLSLKAEMCIGGSLGDLAAAIGWGSCMTLAEIRYYMFIGKIELEKTLIAPIPLARFTFTMKLPVHQLLKPVTDYIGRHKTEDELMAVQMICVYEEAIRPFLFAKGFSYLFEQCLGYQVWGKSDPQLAARWFWQEKFAQLRAVPSLSVEVFVWWIWWWSVDTWTII